ncbi:MAG: hypothetical protein Q8J68_07920 [Methanolobus sp.]|uniref:hypothetical protein n=1 Tax=Methanolobus sp. TaxID=1874737 RepID=UPI0027302FFA|nr:hypothetical protein [Methanolobus sp.]MDP2217195.1 hypothetical protein [Methanolobus sp.]
MNIELKTIDKIVTSKVSAINIGGQVPSGMKRWVTFLMLDSIQQAGAKSVRLHLASVGVSNPTKTSIVATTHRKMLLDLRASGLKASENITPHGPPLMIPDQPDSDKPLFSIASGKWLGAYCSNTTALVFMQYYDE